ncbi:MAG TPA: hypothetical protein VGL81_03035 [Polyangiaceae bacterium]
MKKILLVAFLGGIALVVTLWAMGRGKNDASTTASPGATTVATPATTTAVPAAPSPAVLGDKASCARLADLCSTSDQKVDTDECEKKLGDARKMSGGSNVDRSEVCLADAKTCAAASGCISGGIGLGATGEFLKGLGSALSH